MYCSIICKAGVLIGIDKLLLVIVLFMYNEKI